MIEEINKGLKKVNRELAMDFHIGIHDKPSEWSPKTYEKLGNWDKLKVLFPDIIEGNHPSLKFEDCIAHMHMQMAMACSKEDSMIRAKRARQYANQLMKKVCWLCSYYNYTKDVTPEGAILESHKYLYPDSSSEYSDALGKEECHKNCSICRVSGSIMLANEMVYMLKADTLRDYKDLHKLRYKHFKLAKARLKKERFIKNKVILQRKRTGVQIRHLQQEVKSLSGHVHELLNQIQELSERYDWIDPKSKEGIEWIHKTVAIKEGWIEPTGVSELKTPLRLYTPDEWAKENKDIENSVSAPETDPRESDTITEMFDEAAKNQRKKKDKEDEELAKRFNPNFGDEHGLHSTIPKELTHPDPDPEATIKSIIDEVPDDFEFKPTDFPDKGTRIMPMMEEEEPCEHGTPSDECLKCAQKELDKQNKEEEQ